MSDAELRTWAEAHPAMPQAVAVLDLFRRLDRLAVTVPTQLADAMDERDKARALVAELSERCHKQSELLSRKAERKEVN